MFSKKLPNALHTYSNTIKFMKVLDGLHEEKSLLVANSLRQYNPALATNKKWLIMLMEEYGVKGVPEGLPLAVLQQVLLNIDTLCGTRGSKIGLELFCSVFSLGEVSVFDDNLYEDPDIIVPNSLRQGFITQDRGKKIFYLCDKVTLKTDPTIQITIRSKYFNGEFPKEAEVIKDYIIKNFPYQMGFSPDKKIAFSFESAPEFIFHELLNDYFSKI